MKANNSNRKMFSALKKGKNWQSDMRKMTAKPVSPFLKRCVLDQLILCLWLYVALHIIHKNDLSNLPSNAAWRAQSIATQVTLSFPPPPSSIRYPLDYKTIFYVFTIFLLVPDVALSLIAFALSPCDRCVLKCVSELSSFSSVLASSVHNNLNINHFVFKQQQLQRHVWKFFSF